MGFIVFPEYVRQTDKFQLIFNNYSLSQCRNGIGWNQGINVKNKK